jgi:RHS repeat-associated protein
VSSGSKPCVLPPATNAAEVKPSASVRLKTRRSGGAGKGYDANGNATARQGNSIVWSSYNYPTTVNAGSGSTAETVAFAYGPDRKRWQQMYTGNGTSETTNYVGGLLEVVSSGSVTDYRHYIYAGAEPVAVYSRKTSGVNTFSYLLSDHQGSLTAIINSSGTPVVNESFTPFGNRRNALTWSGPNTTGNLTEIAGITREGYTFQTALGLWMGMNHMNGRVQDAVTGRMLSADPRISDQTDAQNYNRYSYTNSNPLTYLDPTGFTGCPKNGCLPNSPPPPGGLDFTGGVSAGMYASMLSSGTYASLQSFTVQSGSTSVNGTTTSVGTFVMQGGNLLGEWLNGQWIPCTDPGCGDGSNGSLQGPTGNPAGLSANNSGPSGPSGSPAQNPAKQAPVTPTTTPPNPHSWVCDAGNALESTAAKGNSVGQGLETAGMVVAVIGGAAAGPEGAAPGGVVMAIGGATTLGSAGAQFIGGLLQLGSDWSTGIQNVQAGGASLLTGSAFLFAPGFFGLPGSNGVQRAFNRNLNLGFALGGAGVDALNASLPGMEPQQANCP